MEYRNNWEKEFPGNLDPTCWDLVSKLCYPNLDLRLGKNGALEVKRHPWFIGIDWNSLDRHSPPIIPPISDETFGMHESIKCMEV
jgi:protein kinase X